MSKERDNQPKPQTLEDVSAQAVDVLLEHGSHVPTLLIEGDRGGVAIAMPDIAPTHEERIEQMALAGFAIARRNKVGQLQQVFFITEAWMSAFDKGQLPTQPPRATRNEKRYSPCRSYRCSKTRVS